MRAAQRRIDKHLLTGAIVAAIVGRSVTRPGVAAQPA
jgi:hypothetical protein